MARERNWSLLLGAFGIGVVFAILVFMGMASAQTAAAERGKAVYEHWCSHCHAAGPGHPGTQSLEIKYRGELPAVLEDREDLTPEFIRIMVRQGILMMAPFRKTEVTDAELDDMIMYLTD